MAGFSTPPSPHTQTLACIAMIILQLDQRANGSSSLINPPGRQEEGWGRGLHVNEAVVASSPAIVNPLNCSWHSCEHIKMFRVFHSQLLNHRECIQQNTLPAFYTRVKPERTIKW